MLSEDERQRRNERLRRVWDKEAPGYDRRIGWFERRVFGEDHRPWACSQAAGDTLEVAIGTGLNLPFYGPGVELTGLDLSPAMLDIARKRAADSGRAIELHEGDAHHLPFEDESFDSVVCTYSLCNIPDLDRSIAEMRRVLKPGGRLLLVDHVKSPVRLIYWMQKAIEFFTFRLEGEHMTRRPFEHLSRHGFEVGRQQQFRWGIIERLSAARTS